MTNKYINFDRQSNKPPTRSLWHDEISFLRLLLSREQSFIRDLSTRRGIICQKQHHDIYFSLLFDKLTIQVVIKIVFMSRSSLLTLLYDKIYFMK